MIAIKFGAKYEDRLTIFLKYNSLGIKSKKFIDRLDADDFKRAFWIFELNSQKETNDFFNTIKEFIDIMGVNDLEFCYAYNEKELYTQYTSNYKEVSWFKFT